MVIGHRMLERSILPYLQALPHDALYLLIDECVARLHDHWLAPLKALLPSAHILSIASGEANKNISSLETIWRWLIGARASRQSVLIIVGGGALTDLAGMAAATYMRGIRTVNISTTLLGMVDASVGGKTAIDLAGVKNIVGAFHTPEEVFLDVSFLETLPEAELYSGYAELIKTALLDGQDFWHTILKAGDPINLSHTDWIDLIERAVQYKEHIVEADPTEQGIRRVLNLGHTVGHALEAYSHSCRRMKPLLHGEAVMVGLIVEMYLCIVLREADRTTFSQLRRLYRELYSPAHYICKDYPELIGLMRSDKKNRGGTIAIIGLLQPGETCDLELTDEELLKEALDFYRETFGS